MTTGQIGHDELNSISLNQIHIFLVAASRENFSRAARELKLTQAYVSKIISGLEEKTGVKLFNRSLSYVKLTAAGRNLYEEWSRVYRKILDSVDISLEIQKDSFDILRIGDNSELKGNIYLCPIIQSYQEDHKEIFLKYDQESFVLLVEDLLFGKYDMVFCSAMQIPELERAGLKWKIIFPDKLCVALSKDHPLVVNGDFTLDDLNHESFVLINKEIWPAYYDTVERIMVRHGVSIQKMYYVDNTHSAFIATLCKKGVWICDRMFYPSYDCYLEKYDIYGELGGVVAAWDEKNQNPHIKKFIKYIQFYLNTNKSVEKP